MRRRRWTGSRGGSRPSPTGRCDDHAVRRSDGQQVHQDRLERDHDRAERDQQEQEREQQDEAEHERHDDFIASFQSLAAAVLPVTAYSIPRPCRASREDLLAKRRERGVRDLSVPSPTSGMSRTASCRPVRSTEIGSCIWPVASASLELGDRGADGLGRVPGRSRPAEARATGERVVDLLYDWISSMRSGWRRDRSSPCAAATPGAPSPRALRLRRSPTRAADGGRVEDPAPEAALAVAAGAAGRGTAPAPSRRDRRARRARPGGR